MNESETDFHDIVQIALLYNVKIEGTQISIGVFFSHRFIYSNG